MDGETSPGDSTTTVGTLVTPTGVREGEERDEGVSTSTFESRDTRRCVHSGSEYRSFSFPSEGRYRCSLINPPSEFSSANDTLEEVLIAESVPFRSPLGRDLDGTIDE